MPTVELPRETWIRGLDEFTASHDGWLVSLEIVGPDFGAQPEIRNLPLLGISADPRDSSRTVAVSVARSAREHFTHFVPDVQRIYIARLFNGAGASVEIESADGTTTILRLRTGTIAPVDPDHRLAPAGSVQ